MKNKILVVAVILLGLALLLETVYLVGLERRKRAKAWQVRLYQPAPTPRLTSNIDTVFTPPVIEQDPFQELRLIQERMNLMQERMNRLFEEDFTRPTAIFYHPYTFTLRDSGTSYNLRMFVPGLSREDISIELKDGYLKISGFKKTQKQIKDKGFAQEESEAGSFTQVLKVPDDALVKEITSEYKDQVLTVTLPKKKEAAKAGTKIPVR